MNWKDLNKILGIVLHMIRGEGIKKHLIEFLWEGWDRIRKEWKEM